MIKKNHSIKIARIVVFISDNQDLTHYRILSNRYLEGVASVFDLQVSSFVIDELSERKEADGHCCHRWLVYEYSTLKMNNNALELLGSTVGFLQGLSVYFDVYLDPYPYHLKL